MAVAANLSDRSNQSAVRTLADQAFSRAAGAPLIPGNAVRLLRDAKENYPAWLDAIHAARDHIHFESYIIYEDEVGEMFARALIDKARSGVRVRLIYDWLGGLGKASSKFWRRLREGGVDVRCYNPPKWDAPLSWVSRDHRKLLVVDGTVGFVTGLCVGQMWSGNPTKNIEPWRDTGVEVRGPAVAELEHAFAQAWAMLGTAIETDIRPPRIAGDVAIRVVATLPATAGMFRLDQIVAALARKRVWLTDAYYAGTATYVQALTAAAADGVDVRLLVPSSSDIPLLSPFSRAGYRSLLQAGVRVFEWNGIMLHAKTAVADGRWARVGSTNLNIASWLGNCELDAVIEDEAFAEQMEQMYLEDLSNATEIVLDLKRNRVRAPDQQPNRRLPRRASGRAGRAASSAVRIGNTIGAAFMNRRALEPVESRIMGTSGILLLICAFVFAVLPKLLVYPLMALSIWIGVALLYKAYVLRKANKLEIQSSTNSGVDEDAREKQ
jgi:cardiolipin synthase A/B